MVGAPNARCIREFCIAKKRTSVTAVLSMSIKLADYLLAVLEAELLGGLPAELVAELAADPGFAVVTGYL